MTYEMTVWYSGHDAHGIRLFAADWRSDQLTRGWSRNGFRRDRRARFRLSASTQFYAASHGHTAGPYLYPHLAGWIGT